eukprot:gene11766-13889_t
MPPSPYMRLMNHNCAVARMFRIIVVLVFGNTCAHAQYPCTAEFCNPNSVVGWPNIHAALSGYNIVKGSPLGSSKALNDPGFRTGQIFDYIVPAKGGAYTLHSGIVAKDAVNCNIDQSTQIVTTISGYQDAMASQSSQGTTFGVGLETEVSAEVEGVGIKTTVPPLLSSAFSGSEAFNSNVRFFTKMEGIVAVNNAICSTYTTFINSYDPPPFSTGFMTALRDLHETTSKDDAAKDAAAFKFITTFGTHFMATSVMGAKISVTRRYSREEYNRATKDGIQKCNSERINMFAAGLSGGETSTECTDMDSSTLKGSDVDVKREYISSYGSKPAGDGAGLRDWSNQEFTAPLPIRMGLSPILNLFQKSYMGSFDGIDYSAILRWVAPRYYAYCENYQSRQHHSSLNGEAVNISELCYVDSQKGCGWNDNCQPGREQCIDAPSQPSGYFCCKNLCNNAESDPCLNGGRCSMDYSACSSAESLESAVRCECKDGYYGNLCGDRYVDSGDLTTAIKDHMRENQSPDNSDYAELLQQHLTAEYPKYWFFVTAYGEVHGYEHHAFRFGTPTKHDGVASIFRTFGRNVVVFYCIHLVPADDGSNAEFQELEKRVSNANDNVFAGVGGKPHAIDQLNSLYPKGEGALDVLIDEVAPSWFLHFRFYAKEFLYIGMILWDATECYNNNYPWVMGAVVAINNIVMQTECSW